MLSFDGGSLHAQDILYNDLENKLKIIDTTMIVRLLMPFSPLKVLVVARFELY